MIDHGLKALLSRDMRHLYTHFLCSPLFLAWEVKRPIFACVHLEEGDFLDFSQLSLYRVFFQTWVCFYFPWYNITLQISFQIKLDIKRYKELAFPKETQAKRGLFTSQNFLTQRCSVPFTHDISWYSNVRWCQLNKLERKLKSNQSNVIKCDQIVAIRLSDAIESQSNGWFLGNIWFRLRFRLTFDWFEW